MKLTKTELKEIVKESVKTILNENLKTHDDEFNIYEKLDELDISYNFINERENIIEIDTPNKDVKKKVLWW